ncbi:MAG: hypothetical protein ACQEQO_00840 [Thermodesulfobacteriota bacterium]
MDFFEVTGGRVLKRPTREPRPPARRAYAPEGTEKKPIVFRSIGVMQRSRYVSAVPKMRPRPDAE